MTRKQTAARRSFLIGEIARMSHDGWRSRDYARYEAELKTLNDALAARLVRKPRQKFIVLVESGDLLRRAFGPYSKFREAEGDAKTITRPDLKVCTLVIEDPDDLP